MRCGENTLSPCQEGGVWSNFRVVVESVMYDEGIFKMWYLGNNKNIGAVSKLGYATSSDGITWNTYASNPIFPAQDIYALQFVGLVKYSGLYYLYYRSTDGATEISVATSSDGIAWSSQDQNPIIPGNIDSVHLLDNRIIALKNGYIGESKDGISFVFNDNQKVIDVDNPQISLVSDAGTIRAWYVAVPATFRAAIYYATAPLSILDTILPVQIDPLVLRYMPVLAMGEGESYRPMDVDSYVEKSALWDTNGLRDDVQVRAAGDLTMSEFENIVGQGSTADMYLAFSTPDTAGTLDISAAQVAYQSSGATSTVYYRKMIDGDYTVLQYWYFYAMNDWRDKGGFNNHEGDWESVFVYLKTDDIASGPEYVAYSAHHNDGDSTFNVKQYDSVRRTWNGGEVLKEGDSPISFVAVGSHANYPGNNDGKHRVGLKYDRTSDIEANKIHPADFAQKTAISETTPFWMNYEGLWGTNRSIAYLGRSGPQGPAFNNVSGTIRFSNPVKWAGIDKIIKRIIKENKKQIVFNRPRVTLDFQKEVLAGTSFEVSPYDEVVSFGAIPDNVVMLPGFYDIESSLDNNTFDVDVSLPYDAQVLAALGGNAKNLKAFLYEPAGNTWTMQDSDVNLENQTVSFETTHFSRYAIGFVKEASLEDLFDTLVGQIKDSSLQQYHKRYLVRYARLVERFANRDSRYGKRIAIRLLKNMDRMFNRYAQRGYLTESQQEEISATIEDIEDVLKNAKKEDEHEWKFKKQKHWKKYGKREE